MISTCIFHIIVHDKYLIKVSEYFKSCTGIKKKKLIKIFNITLYIIDYIQYTDCDYHKNKI